MSENLQAQACTDEEANAARAAGILILTTQDERDLHDFAERIRAPLAERIAELERVQGMLEAALQTMVEITEPPPDKNCSCFISPPCNDCINWEHIREALETAKEALSAAQNAHALRILRWDRRRVHREDGECHCGAAQKQEGGERD